MGSEVATSIREQVIPIGGTLAFVSFRFLCVCDTKLQNCSEKKKKKTSRKVHPCELPIAGYYEVSK